MGGAPPTLDNVQSCTRAAVDELPQFGPRVCCKWVWRVGITHPQVWQFVAARGWCFDHMAEAILHDRPQRPPRFLSRTVWLAPATRRGCLALSSLGNRNRIGAGLAAGMDVTISNNVQSRRPHRDQQPSVRHPRAFRPAVLAASTSVTAS